METNTQDKGSEPDYVTARRELAAMVAEVGFSVESVPTTRKDWGTGDKFAGHYAFTLRANSLQGRLGRVADVLQHTGTYSVGSGILAQWGAIGGNVQRGYGKGWDSSLFKSPAYRMGGRLSVDQAAGLENIRAAYRPDVVDVLASLLSDTSDLEPDDTFRDWVDRSGMDWKNPADALDCFEAIRGSGRFLRRVLSADEFGRMRELAGRL